VPDITRFEPVLSGKALAVLLSLKKRQQRKLSDLLFRLAEYPHQPGDYDSKDDRGRQIQHLRVGPLVVSFWPDDASRELRITEIEEL
jgi:mRNA-degrading endonuclease RelE of RelBE toxin-antitoxin system